LLQLTGEWEEEGERAETKFTENGHLIKLVLDNTFSIVNCIERFAF
jgi:hypothetical protein